MSNIKGTGVFVDRRNELYTRGRNGRNYIKKKLQKSNVS